MKQRKISYPYRETNPGRQAHSLSLYRLSYPGKKNVSDEHKDMGHKTLFKYQELGLPCD
jgi:hypothetical protein